MPEKTGKLIEHYCLMERKLRSLQRQGHIEHHRGIECLILEVRNATAKIPLQQGNQPVSMEMRIDYGHIRSLFLKLAGEINGN